MIAEIITFTLAIGAGIAGTIFFKKEDVGSKIKAELDTVKADFVALETKVESYIKSDETKVTNNLESELSKLDVKEEPTNPEVPEAVTTPSA